MAAIPVIFINFVLSCGWTYHITRVNGGDKLRFEALLRSIAQTWIGSLFTIEAAVTEPERARHRFTT